MSSFEETVAKIASNPASRELASHMLAFFKGANTVPGMPHVPKPSGLVSNKVLEHVLGATAVGAGGYLMNKLLDKLDSSADRLSAERKEFGQLTGEHRFRMHSVQRLKPLHAEIMHSLEVDPEFAKAPPDLVKSTYSTMRRFAPYLAADPNVARSFVRTHAIHGELPSYATLKTLADAEQSVNKAGVMEI